MAKNWFEKLKSSDPKSMNAIDNRLSAETADHQRIKLELKPLKILSFCVGRIAQRWGERIWRLVEKKNPALIAAKKMFRKLIQLPSSKWFG